MKWSDNITNIAAAICKAQSQIEDATKNGLNPVFKSKYADLAAVRSVIREPLAASELAVIQGPRRAEGGVDVETMILHRSGEWISETVFVPVSKWDAHGVGSAITYGRRYGLMALLCIATDDDDGNAAVQSGGTPAPAKKAPSKTEVAILRSLGEAEAKKGTDALRDWFRKLSASERDIASSFLEPLKEMAAESSTTPAAPAGE